MDFLPPPESTFTFPCLNAMFMPCAYPTQLVHLTYPTTSFQIQTIFNKYSTFKKDVYIL